MKRPTGLNVSNTILFIIMNKSTMNIFVLPKDRSYLLLGESQKTIFWYEVKTMRPHMSRNNLVAAKQYQES